MATGMVRSRSKRSLARDGVRTPVRDDVLVVLPIAWPARVPEPQFREREQSNEGRWSTDRKRSARTSHNLGAQASQMPVQLRYLQDAAASSAVAVLHTTQA